jgi:hypothetical protein
MISTLENNSIGEWELKLRNLSPETRELFWKHSGRLITLGRQLRDRDVRLQEQRSKNLKPQNP